MKKITNNYLPLIWFMIVFNEEGGGGGKVVGNGVVVLVREHLTRMPKLRCLR